MSSIDHFKKSYSGRNVLVTGGLGFIGSNLTRTLLALGARVTILDSLIPEYGGNRRNRRGLERKGDINLAGVLYPGPVHRQPAYARTVDLSHTGQACAEVISLPLHPDLGSEEIDRVVQAVRDGIH